MSYIHTVLVGAGGTSTAFGAVMALRRHWDTAVRVIVMDTNPPHLVATSLLSDAYEVVPASSDPAFIEVISSTVERYGVDTYLPLIDHEVAIAAGLLEAGQLPKGLRLLAPPAAAAALCLDKLAAHEWMVGQGIPTPTTREIKPEVPEGEWFLKPRRGFGSRGTRLVTLAGPDSMTPEEREHCIVQAVCTGPEITLDVFHSPLLGFDRVVCRERLETKGGVCTKARVFEDSDLASLAIGLAKKLEFNGGFCMQVMRCEGQWVVTDINARLGGGTAMSVPLGIDFFAAALSTAWNEDPIPFLPPLEGEAYVVRQHSEFVTRRGVL